MASKIIVFLFIILLAFAGQNFAQQNKKPLQFQSINSIGLIEGQAGSAFQLETVNGVKYRSWFGGIGVGLDYYRYRTMPLFADFRKEFGKTTDHIFVYADAGVNFYWGRDKDQKQFQLQDKFENGFFGEAGAGYAFKTGKRGSILLNVGYSYKKIIEKGTYYYDIGFPGPMNLPLQKINYDLNRIVIKAAFAF
jgi:hypothetical protein